LKAVAELWMVEEKLRLGQDKERCSDASAETGSERRENFALVVDGEHRGFWLGMRPGLGPRTRNERMTGPCQSGRGLARGG
jgi:hypothetical protein